MSRPGSHILLLVLALIFVIDSSPLRAQRSRGPFDDLAGQWTGGGTITLSSGVDERIRCRASYLVSNAGAHLQQMLRCASDSYNFDLRSTVAYEGGAIRGTWIESSRNASGTVSGRANAGLVQASVIGPTFSAVLALSTRGDQQNVTITSQGSALTRASVSLVRTQR